MVDGDDQTVSWAVTSDPAGTNVTALASVTTDGVFMAAEKGFYRVTATSTADPTLNGASVIKVVSSVTPIPTAPVGVTRKGYSVTALKDGRILIVGGYDASNVPSGVGQVYDPATGAFTNVSNTLNGVAYHSAVLLDDGRVLLSGGFTGNQGTQGPDYEQRSAAVYDPVSNSFQELPVPTNTTYPPPSSHGLMRGAHVSGTAVKLMNGQVLVVGDDYNWSLYNGHIITAYQAYRRSDVFDPTTNTFDVSNWTTNPPYYWGPTPNCFETLPGQTAVALDDGRALITGGHVPPVADMVDPCTGATKTPYGENAGAYPYSACIKNDAKILANGASSTIQPMMFPRSFHTMTKLADGRVLIAGGYQSVSFDATPLQRDPVTDRFEPNTQFTATASAEIFDPVTGTFTPTGSMNDIRALHAAILLPTGKVLIVGGTRPVGPGAFSYPTTTELYDPDTGTFSVMDNLGYGLEEPKLALGAGGTLFISGVVQGSIPASSQAFVQGIAATPAFGSTGWFLGITTKPLEILQVYPELFSKVKTESNPPSL